MTVVAADLRDSKSDASDDESHTSVNAWMCVGPADLSRSEEEASIEWNHGF